MDIAFSYESLDLGLQNEISVKIFWQVAARKVENLISNILDRNLKIDSTLLRR